VIRPLAAALAAIAAALLVTAGSGAADVDSRLRVAVVSGDTRVRATAGTSSLADPQYGFVVTDGRYPLPVGHRLLVRGGAPLAIETKDPASAVRVRLKSRHSRELSGAAAAVQADASGRHWLARLPRRLPSRADRVGVAADYPDGSVADFEAGIRVRAR
jgi:hypothetical protein